MKTDNDLFMIPIREFLGSKQSNLFQTLKQPQFTGELVFNSSQGKEWVFYFYLGRILYATGGEHNVRRWQRNLIAYAPQLIIQWSSLAEEINPKTDIKECWQYDLLSFWLNKQEITRKQAIKLIHSIIVEILFDLTQAMEVTFQLKATPALTTQLVLIDPDQVIVEAWRLWQNWQGAKLADRSPNSAPIIRQKDGLSKRTSPKTYKVMNKMFNGQNTLRDLALQLQQDITHMTRLMIPYIQLGFIELIEVDDIPSPLMNLIPTENDSRPEKGMIVCVDRSFSVAERIKAIVTTAGYKFLSFDNSNLAIASILAEKPDLIFLDLDSPNFSAYEICVRLRELSFLSDIPIVIMTENLGLMDRVRAKIVGCSDFLQKPIESKALLEMITKHIKKINS
jgi:chemotaxis family two-component system response regulator PixG